jgi:hypothetical protein
MLIAILTQEHCIQRFRFQQQLWFPLFLLNTNGFHKPFGFYIFWISWIEM